MNYSPPRNNSYIWIVKFDNNQGAYSIAVVANTPEAARGKLKNSIGHRSCQVERAFSNPEDPESKRTFTFKSTLASRFVR